MPGMDRIHALWDELADFDAAHADDALRHLLRGLCDIGQASNALWMGALRLDTLAANDPVKGWRPGAICHLHPLPILVPTAREEAERLDQGECDLTTLRNLEQVGWFRANRLCDLVGPEWFASDYYRRKYFDTGRGDAVWIAFPVNQDAESWFGVFRANDQPRFTEAERDHLAYALRGLKWFHRQLLLSHGLLLAGTPLTPAERKVLHLLLTGLPEKLIADQLERSHHTVHDSVCTVFRKFGVKNRASLMALWLGSGA